MVNKYLVFEDEEDSPFVCVFRVTEYNANEDGSIPTETQMLGKITQDEADKMKLDADINLKLSRNLKPIKKQL